MLSWPSSSIFQSGLHVSSCFIWTIRCSNYLKYRNFGSIELDFFFSSRMLSLPRHRTMSSKSNNFSFAQLKRCTGKSMLISRKQSTNGDPPTQTWEWPQRRRWIMTTATCGSSWKAGINALDEESANFFCKGPEAKILGSVQL